MVFWVADGSILHKEFRLTTARASRKACLFGYNNNKSNSPYQNNNQSHSKGHYANYGAMPNISCYNKESSNYNSNNGVGSTSNQCYLPSLSKNVYHVNFKKFHQMIKNNN